MKGVVTMFKDMKLRIYNGIIEYYIMRGKSYSKLGKKYINKSDKYAEKASKYLDKMFKLAPELAKEESD